MVGDPDVRLLHAPRALPGACDGKVAVAGEVEQERRLPGGPECGDPERHGAVGAPDVAEHLLKRLQEAGAVRRLRVKRDGETVGRGAGEAGLPCGEDGAERRRRKDAERRPGEESGGGDGGQRCHDDDHPRIIARTGGGVQPRLRMRKGGTGIPARDADDCGQECPRSVMIFA